MVVVLLKFLEFGSGSELVLAGVVAFRVGKQNGCWLLVVVANTIKAIVTEKVVATSTLTKVRANLKTVTVVVETEMANTLF